MLFRMAWRNIWRNRRRTLISMASIVFAVFLCIAMDSISKGLLDRMKENVVSIYTGYVQIHKNEYWSERSLENSFEQSVSTEKDILRHREVFNIVPRLEAFLLTASDDRVKGAMIVGIEPNRESLATALHTKVSNGTYLMADDQAVMITEGLANYLHLSVGDTLIIIGQGYHGASAVNQYPVKALVKFGSPDLNEGLVYLPLKTCQNLLAADNRLTAYVLMIRNNEKAMDIVQKLKELVGGEYEVMSWQDMSPELYQFIEGENTENVVFQVVLYLLITFGIFGTILMMTLERQREFGILVAIGMYKKLLASMIILENLMITLLGAIGGLLFSAPIIFYFYLYPIQLKGSLAEAYQGFGIEPIYYFSTDPIVFYRQALIVLILAIALSFYPIINIKNLIVVQAMRK